jgi:hypothetical protein
VLLSCPHCDKPIKVKVSIDPTTNALRLDLSKSPDRAKDSAPIWASNRKKRTQANV